MKSIKLIVFINLLIFNYIYCNSVTNLRVLKSYLSSGIPLQCPLTGAPNQVNTLISTNDIVWINEENQENKPDSDIRITNSIILYQASLKILLNTQITDLSCGYYYHPNKYVRIKKWKLSYIDYVNVHFDAKIDEDKLTFTKLNDTYGHLKISDKINLDTLSTSGDLIKFSCKNNFDLPLTTAVIWLNYIKYENGIKKIDEKWNRFSTSQNQNELLQNFYNSDSDRYLEFSEFLKNLFRNPDNSVLLTMYCAYYSSPTEVVAQSKPFTYVRSSDGVPPPPPGSKKWPIGLILGIVFGILGFLLLLALLIILIICCCCRKRKDKSNTKLNLKINLNMGLEANKINQLL